MTSKKSCATKQSMRSKEPKKYKDGGLVGSVKTAQRALSNGGMQSRLARAEAAAMGGSAVTRVNKPALPKVVGDAPRGNKWKAKPDSSGGFTR